MPTVLTYPQVTADQFFQFSRYVPVSALKHYFNVSNSYVVRKLLLVLFPWRHKPWTRQQTRMATSSTNPEGMFLNNPTP